MARSTVHRPSRKVPLRSDRAAIVAHFPGLLFIPAALICSRPVASLLFRDAMEIPYNVQRLRVFFWVFTTLTLIYAASLAICLLTPAARWLAAKGHRAGLTFAAGLISLLVLLPDALLGIPLAGFQYLPHILDPDPQLDYRHKPNCDASFANQPFGTNSLGLRDPERAPQPSPGVRRILLLGDSVVFGMGVPFEETLPARLDRTLGPDVEVVNAGIIGYQAHQYFYHARETAEALNPDLVIVGITLNDLAFARARLLDRSPLDPAAKPLEPTPWNRLRWFVRFHSGLLNVGKIWTEIFWLNEKSEDQIGYEVRAIYRLIDNPPILSYQSEVFARYIEAMTAQLRARGVPVVAVIFPYRFQFSPREQAIRPEFLAVQGHIREVLERLEIPAIDSYHALQAMLQSDGGDASALFQDHNHLSSHGCAMLAEVIRRAFFADEELSAEANSEAH